MKTINILKFLIYDFTLSKSFLRAPPHTKCYIAERLICNGVEQKSSKIISNPIDFGYLSYILHT